MGRVINFQMTSGMSVSLTIFMWMNFREAKIYEYVYH